MTEYDNNNTGAIFKNDKGENDRRPDLTGTAEVDGVEYRVSAWKKVSRNGKAFFSLRFENKEEFDSRQRERFEDAEGADALEL